mgnify:CR=1 FL=1
MIELLLTGFSNIFSVECGVLIIIGVVIGVIFGAIPGLSANMAVALFLPFTFTMEPIPAMTLLVSLYIGGISGGLVAAILINIPGTPASVATCFDGNPMARKGQAGLALDISVISSFIGGLISFVILIFISPLVARVALKFGSFEYAAIGIFSLSLISSLVGKSVIKGLIGCFIGLILASVGVSPVGSQFRFTFGFHALDNGFNVLTLLIGLFAVSEVIKTAENKYLLSNLEVRTYEDTKTIDAFKIVLSQKTNLIRSALIGTGIGILPGLGGSTANLVAYAAAKTSSNEPDKFGTGIPDGIIASETSNNATIGGALVPLLTMGIPGDTVTALLLGGLMMHGITPGPLLFTTDGDLVYGIFAALLLGNVVMAFVMLKGMKHFSKVLKIKKHILLPIVMTLCLVGSFGLNNRIFDMWCVLFFGIMGYFLEKIEIPNAPIIMGFILGPIIELNLQRGMMASDGSLLPLITRPVAAIFILIGVLTIILTFYRNANRGRTNTENSNC